jgi:hypothetical protein
MPRKVDETPKVVADEKSRHGCHGCGQWIAKGEEHVKRKKVHVSVGPWHAGQWSHISRFTMQEFYHLACWTKKEGPAALAPSLKGPETASLAPCLGGSR